MCDQVEMQQYLCQTQRRRDIQEKGEKTSLEFSVWQYFDQSTQTCDESHRYEAQATKLKLTFVAQQQKHSESLLQLPALLLLPLLLAVLCAMHSGILGCPRSTPLMH